MNMTLKMSALNNNDTVKIETSCQVEDMAAVEVVVAEDEAVVASQTTDQDHKVMKVAMMAMRIRVTKKERKSSNLVLLENSMLTHTILQKNK